MKLLFVHHSGLISGAGVSLYNLIKEMKNKHEVVVCLPTEPTDMLSLLNNSEDKIVIDIHTYGRRIGAITWYSGGNNLLSLTFFYRLALIPWQWRYWNKYIMELNPDMVICNSKILCWMGLLPAMKKHKSICFVRETMKKESTNFMNKIMKSLLERFSGVAFISEFDQQKETLKKAKTFVIPNYVDVTRLDDKIEREIACNQLGVPSKTFNVLYVGGIFPMKGFDIAIQAVLECSSNIHLLVAGMSFDDVRKTKSSFLKDYVEKWHDYINQHDKEGRIHILGKQLNMSACYAACDVLLFPMREPHQARPVFEAGYFSKPVIVTDFECIHNDVQEGINGYLVPLEDMNTCSERIQRLQLNPEMAKSMGLKNHEYYQRNHSYENSLNAFRDCLEEISRI